jgi:hypothetical protein
MNNYEDPPGCIFNEQWCPPLTKQSIEWAINQITDDSGEFIEIGCFEGHSTVFTMNLIYPKILTCIDPWVPQPYADYEVKAYRDRDIEGRFNLNIQNGTKLNISINKMGWEEYFNQFTPRISYIYIDGPHAEHDVYNTLQRVVQLVVRGGVIIGDNYDDAAVRAGVKSYFGEDIPHPNNELCFYWRKDA